MSAADQAVLMLTMARKDLKSLGNMVDFDLHDDEIFGFHAQQAVEKALKAWIALRGERYPFTHDLGDLLLTLEKLGEDVDSYWNLVEFTIFGVLYRYENLASDDAPLERELVLKEVRALVTRVASVIDETTQSED